MAQQERTNSIGKIMIFFTGCIACIIGIAANNDCGIAMSIFGAAAILFSEIRRN